jgi:hypothetical protein
VRSFPDCQSIIKAATVSAYEAVGGVTAAADMLGVRSSTLSKYASSGEDWQSNFIRLDLAVQLDRQSAHPFLLSAMDRLVKAERPAGFGSVTASAILKLDGVLDDVVREVARAIEGDDRIDAAERVAIRSKIVAAKQILAQLDAVL